MSPFPPNPLEQKGGFEVTGCRQSLQVCCSIPVCIAVRGFEATGFRQGWQVCCSIPVCIAVRSRMAVGQSPLNACSCIPAVCCRNHWMSIRAWICCCNPPRACRGLVRHGVQSSQRASAKDVTIAPRKTEAFFEKMTILKLSPQNQQMEHASKGLGRRFGVYTF